MAKPLLVSLKNIKGVVMLEISELNILSERFLQKAKINKHYRKMLKKTHKELSILENKTAHDQSFWLAESVWGERRFELERLKAKRREIVAEEIKKRVEYGREYTPEQKSEALTKIKKAELLITLEETKLKEAREFLDKKLAPAKKLYEYAQEIKRRKNHNKKY
jgi:hypothetical protein